jgi:hypothetical protein
VSGDGPLLDRDAIAAMALVYDARRATRDIDAVFQPHGIVLDEARAVAAELGLPGWWLNEQASVYVAPGGDAAAARIFDHPGLRVSAASPEHLLSKKSSPSAPTSSPKKTSHNEPGWSSKTSSPPSQRTRNPRAPGCDGARAPVDVVLGLTRKARSLPWLTRMVDSRRCQTDRGAFRWMAA